MFYLNYYYIYFLKTNHWALNSCTGGVSRATGMLLHYKPPGSQDSQQLRMEAADDKKSAASWLTAMHKVGVQLSGSWSDSLHIVVLSVCACVRVGKFIFVIIWTAFELHQSVLDAEMMRYENLFMRSRRWSCAYTVATHHHLTCFYFVID